MAPMTCTRESSGTGRGTSAVHHSAPHCEPQKPYAYHFPDGLRRSLDLDICGKYLTHDGVRGFEDEKARR